MAIILLGVFIGFGLILAVFSIVVQTRIERQMKTHTRQVFPDIQKQKGKNAETIKILNQEVKQLQEMCKTLYDQLQIAQKKEFELKEELLRRADETVTDSDSMKKAFSLQYKIAQTEKKYEMLDERYKRAILIQRQFFAKNEEAQQKISEYEELIKMLKEKDKSNNKQLQDYQKSIEDVKSRLLEAKKKEVKLQEDLFKQRMIFSENEYESQRLKEEHEDLKNEYKYEKDW